MLAVAERVEGPIEALRAAERGVQVMDAVHAPQKTVDTYNAARDALQRVALGGGGADGFAGMTADELWARVAEIDALVMARRPMS
jgi:hypothetical protein